MDCIALWGWIYDPDELVSGEQRINSASHKRGGAGQNEGNSQEKKFSPLLLINFNVRYVR